MGSENKVLAEEQAKRKELSRTRVFWLLIAVDIALIVYLIIQFLILANS